MEWRVSPGFPCYEVSEFGDVRRCCKGIRGGRVGKVMKAYVRLDGYRMFILRRDNHSFHRKAHQLVAEAFIGLRPFDSAEVCHFDGSRSNDHYNNLRWGTNSDNKADMLRHGTRMMGEQHPQGRLTAGDVEDVRRRCTAGELQRVVAAQFGIGQSHVSRIVRGVRWAHA